MKNNFNSLKNKKIAIIGILTSLIIFLTPGVYGQQGAVLTDSPKYEFGLTVGYGLSSLNSANAKNDPELSVYRGMGAVTMDAYAAYYFNRYMGVHIGIGSSTYTQYFESKKQGIQSINIYIDKDGDSFIPVYNTNFRGFKSLTYINIPFGITTRFPLNSKIGFNARFGAMAGIFTTGSLSVKGNIEACGYYLDGDWAG